jgi:hypothetical protein
MIPLSHHLQRYPILYHRRSASLVAESTPELYRAQIGSGLQVPMALRATEREHIVIRHVRMVFLENRRSATSHTWQQRRGISPSSVP